MPILESVPNVSEGRREATIARLAAAARAGGAALLDRSSDGDHHRTVLTLAGDAASLERGLVELYAAALDEIDLRRHRGVHPRVGAVDVVPFVPLAGASMADAVAAARSLGETVARRFDLPVYLYGEAATAPERRRLASLRRGGFERFGERIADPAWRPDFGPARVHPTAGVTAIGARFFLIAFNVVLASAEAAIARRVARRVRESSGGLPALQALGLALAGRGGRAQVSMNLTDYRRTSLVEAFDAVRREAAAAGVEVLESELVGLVPEAAVAGVEPARIGLPRLAAGQILERRLAQAGLLPRP